MVLLKTEVPGWGGGVVGWKSSIKSIEIIGTKLKREDSIMTL